MLYCYTTTLLTFAFTIYIASGKKILLLYKMADSCPIRAKNKNLKTHEVFTSEKSIKSIHMYNLVT